MSKPPANLGFLFALADQYDKLGSKAGKQMADLARKQGGKLAMKWTPHTLGSKYEVNKDLDIGEIAKRVRKELAAGFGKGWKFKVTIKRYSGGQSLTANAVQAPARVVLWEPAPKVDEYSRGWNLSPTARDAEEKIKQIVNAYNFNNSDTQADYSHVNFYAHVSVRDAAEAQYKADSGRAGRQQARLDLIASQPMVPVPTRAAKGRGVPGCYCSSLPGAALCDFCYPRPVAVAPTRITFVDGAGHMHKGVLLKRIGNIHSVQGDNGTIYHVPLENIGNVGGKRRHAPSRAPKRRRNGR